MPNGQMRGKQAFWLTRRFERHSKCPPNDDAVGGEEMFLNARRPGICRLSVGVVGKTYNRSSATSTFICLRIADT